MIPLASTEAITTATFAVAFLLCVFLGSGKYRLSQMLRYYSFQGVCLTGLWLSLTGFEFGWVYLSAFFVLVFKAVLIPGLIARSAHRAGASGRLLSFIRPAPAYFVAGSLLLLAVIASLALTRAWPELDLLLAVSACAAMLVGAMMLVTRRDFYSQMIGVFTFENGSAILVVGLLGNWPLWVELGVFLTLVAEAALMSILSGRLKELYAVEDTAELEDLAE